MRLKLSPDGIGVESCETLISTGDFASRKLAAKNFGDAHRVPVVAFFYCKVLSASCCFSSLLSSWLPWIYSPFPFFMESCNGVLLQLIECIESTQSEVKRKMSELKSHIEAPKSPD